MFKPWLTKNVKETRRSTERDYPPKRKKPWLAGSFPEMEHFHERTYRPMGYPVVPPRADRCAGRVLRPDQQVTWECGGDFPKTFQTSVSGAVGNVTYSLDPVWSEINEEGDVATIDENGIIQIGDEETEVCQGPYPPWIIYNACDDCGCSSGTIWLEDCSGDCDLCVDVDCELPTLTGGDTTTTSNTLQMGLSDAQGDVSWAVSGVDVTIDQTGLVTTGASACGTFTVTATDSCCGDFTQEVRVTNNGTLVQLGPSCTADEGYKTGGPDCQEWVGGTRTQYWYCVGSSEGCEPHCGNAPCAGDPSITFVKWTERQSWECPP